MSKEKYYSFKKVGYINNLPDNAELSDYESITVIKKNKKIKLYRRKEEGKKFDDSINFSNSWNIFNSLI